MEALAVCHYDATILTVEHQITTSSDWDAKATADIQWAERIEFHAHPASSRLVQIWGGDQRWRVSRRRYKMHLAKRRIETGNAVRDKTAALPYNGMAPDTSVKAGLSTLAWKRIQRIVGLNTYERQLLFRLKAGKLSLWNRRDYNVACPSPACPTVRVANSEHVFWECPDATALWQPTSNLWQDFGLDLGGYPAAAIFRLQLSDAPKMAWARIRDVTKDTRLTDEHHDLLFPMADVLWQYFCGATIANIWRCRNILIKCEEVSRANTSQFAMLRFASA